MMKIQEQEAAANALANQLAAGIAMREAVWRMNKIQPKYAEMWKTASEEIARGKFLSEQLVGYWPDELLASLRAGEEGGKVDIVLRRIVVALELKQKANKAFSKLISPVVSGLAGIGVFVFFMVAVIPTLQKSLGGGEQSFLFKVSDVMHHLAVNYWPFIVGIFAFLVVFVVQWLKDADNKEKIVGWLDTTPKLGEAMRKIYFGTWAYYLAVLDTAGLPIKQQLLLSINTLPEVFRAGVQLMANEVEKRGRADSADPEKQTQDDPRREWPYYIAAAFMNAHETGELDKEMERAAPILIDEGLRDLNKVTSVLDLVAKVLAATLIAMPMLAYFTQLSYALTKAFQS